MDTAIEKGDFVTDAGGIPKQLFGLEQQLQQVYLRLKGRRGCFYYDPFFGSRLHTLPEHPTREQILSCVEEALRDWTAVTVTSLEQTEEELVVSVTTDLGSGTVTV